MTWKRSVNERLTRATGYKVVKAESLVAHIVRGRLPARR